MTEEQGAVTIRRPSLPLGNIAGNRNSGSSHLARQAVDFLFREALSLVIHGFHQVHSILPNPEIPARSGHKVSSPKISALLEGGCITRRKLCKDICHNRLNFSVDRAPKARPPRSEVRGPGPRSTSPAVPSNPAESAPPPSGRRPFHASRSTDRSRAITG